MIKHYKTKLVTKKAPPSKTNLSWLYSWHLSGVQDTDFQFIATLQL